MKICRHLILLPIFAGVLRADEPRLTVNPQALHGIPGESLKAELTVETTGAAPVRLQIPAVSNLILRAVEKIPVQRTDRGTFVQKRTVLWQGIAPGTSGPLTMTAGVGEQTVTFPPLVITIDPVTPAPRPEKQEKSTP